MIKIVCLITLHIVAPILSKRKTHFLLKLIVRIQTKNSGMIKLHYMLEKGQVYVNWNHKAVQWNLSSPTCTGIKFLCLHKQVHSVKHIENGQNGMKISIG